MTLPDPAGTAPLKQLEVNVNDSRNRRDTGETLEDIAAGTGLPLAEALVAVTALVDAGAIREVTPGRYVFHGLED